MVYIFFIVPKPVNKSGNLSGIDFWTVLSSGNICKSLSAGKPSKLFQRLQTTKTFW